MSWVSPIMSEELRAVLAELRGYAQSNLVGDGDIVTTTTTLGGLWSKALSDAPRSVFEGHPCAVRDLTAFVAGQCNSFRDGLQLDLDRFQLTMSTIMRTAPNGPCLVVHTPATANLFTACATVVSVGPKRVAGVSTDELFMDQVAVAGVIFLPFCHQLTLPPLFAQSPTDERVLQTISHNMMVMCRDTVPEPKGDIEMVCDCCNQLTLYMVQFCRCCERSTCKSCQHLWGIAICAGCGSRAQEAVRQWKQQVDEETQQAQQTQQTQQTQQAPLEPQPYQSIPYNKKAFYACEPCLLSLKHMHLSAGSPRLEPTIHTMMQLAQHCLNSVTSTCFACHKPCNLRCSGCKSMRYCGVKCQRRSWRKQGHRRECIRSRGA